MGNIILIGFMGTGKSSVGKRLAEKLDLTFVDLDDLIETNAGKSIPEIFSQDGEASFRQQEAAAVQQLAGLKRHVVATGGGVMADPANVKQLQSSGKLICLTARPEVILERTRETLPNRPLLNDGEPAQTIEELLKTRADDYAKATETIDTSDLSVEQVAEEIVKRC